MGFVGNTFRAFSQAGVMRQQSYLYNPSRFGIALFLYLSLLSLLKEEEEGSTLTLPMGKVM